ncbi:MAG TPA: SAM-dependent chlorinase/fluorinase [Terriglobales bacterium]|nr:SAM-dependent chlorinase/fluorinase [Terriglobales bacterium]
MSHTAIITLTTDFGLNDHFVGAMKGVLLETAPDAQIVDISHAVQPFDILDGALTISQAYTYFPAGTVHMVVVDPGVGTARRPIILTGDRHLFVAPDNGVLSLVYDREERISVRHVTADHYFLQPRSNTFHGRDIFSPVAAYLAKGVDPERFGEEITDFARFNVPRPKPVDERTLRGVVLKADRFGNLITNITATDVPWLFGTSQPAFKIAVGKGQVTRICGNYAEGTPGEAFGILGSMGFLEIATNRGSAQQLLSAGKGGEVNVVMEGK